GRREHPVTTYSTDTSARPSTPHRSGTTGRRATPPYCHSPGEKDCDLSNDVVRVLCRPMRSLRRGCRPTPGDGVSFWRPLTVSAAPPSAFGGRTECLKVQCRTHPF